MARAKKVLIISIRAGAGHLRAAQALSEALAEEHPEVEVRHVEALSRTNRAFRRAFSASYEKLVKKLPSVWGMLYGAMERKAVTSRTKKLGALFDRLNAQPLVREAEAFAPDRIVCTHYFPAEVMASRKRERRLDAPVYVTLTDYDIHVMWIQPGVDGYFVATDEMAHALRAKGVGEASVEVTGIPIVPEFARRYPAKAEMRERLGLDPGRATVLVSAGGFGFAGVDRIVSDLADAAGDCQFLAVAGRNAKLERALAEAATERTGREGRKGRGGRIVPFGFVTNMHELMAASDLAVTKPGGLTSSECLAMGLPMVIVNPIPGQEERNSDYLLESGVAVRANSPAHLVYKVGALMADAKRLARMRACAKSIARPRAAYDVASRVIEDDA